MPKKGERAVVGKIDNAQLLLHVQSRLGRFDWFLNGDDTAENTPAPFPDGVKTFMELMKSFLRLQEVPAATRVAFGANIMLPTENVETGYKTISDYLNFDLDRATSSDFLYQINRRRQSKVVPELTVNRLMKWSVGQITRHTLALSSEGLMAVANEERVSTGCNLDLDINTAPQADLTLPKERIENLLLELCELGREIIREGDCP